MRILICFWLFFASLSLAEPSPKPHAAMPTLAGQARPLAAGATNLATNLKGLLDRLKEEYARNREDELLGWAIVLVERYFKSQKGDPFDLCSAYPKNGTPDEQQAWREKHERRIDEVYNRVVGCAVNTIWTLLYLPGTPRDAAPDAIKNFSWNSTAQLGAEATAVSRILALISHLTEEKNSVQFPNPAEALYQLATAAWAIQKQNTSGKLNIIGTLVECLHSILKSAACLVTELNLLSDDLAKLKESSDRLERTAAIRPQPPIHLVGNPDDREEVRLACLGEALYRGRKHGYLARGITSVSPPYPFFEETKVKTERASASPIQVQFRTTVTTKWSYATNLNDACSSFCETRLDNEYIESITNADGKTLSCPTEDTNPHQRRDMIGHCTALCCARLVNYPPVGGLMCGTQSDLPNPLPKIPDHVRKPAPDGKGCSDWVDEVTKGKDFTQWCALTPKGVQRRAQTSLPSPVLGSGNWGDYEITTLADDRCRAHAKDRYQRHHDAPNEDVCIGACRRTALERCHTLMPITRQPIMPPRGVRPEDFYSPEP